MATRKQSRSKPQSAQSPNRGANGRLQASVEPALVLTPGASKVPAQDSDFPTTAAGQRLAHTDDSREAGVRGLTVSDDPISLPFGLVPRGHRVTFDNGTQGFVRCAGTGDGPPVLLLHGLGATGGLNWAPAFTPLAALGPVAALDHRAHGRGPRVGHDFRLADCADDAAAFLRTWDKGPAIVVGYSMGGPIAQLMALRHPETVAGLVLAATARDFGGRPAERLRFAALGVLAATARFGPSSVARRVPVLPGSLFGSTWAMAELGRHDPAGVLAAASSLGRFSSREWTGELDVPATVIVHSRDRLVPPHRQEKLAAALPDARIVRIDGDHLAVMRGGEIFNRALLAARRQVIQRARRRPTTSSRATRAAS
jgi:pimeloyl-ACP methyl ester carboxylesterase